MLSACHPKKTRQVVTHRVGLLIDRHYAMLYSRSQKCSKSPCEATCVWTWSLNYTWKCLCASNLASCRLSTTFRQFASVWVRLSCTTLLCCCILFCTTSSSETGSALHGTALVVAIILVFSVGHLLLGHDQGAMSGIVFSRLLVSDYGQSEHSHDWHYHCVVRC